MGRRLTAVAGINRLGMALSRKAKESLKTALAMTVTHGIALQMELDQPHWAAFIRGFDDERIELVRFLKG